MLAQHIKYLENFVNQQIEVTIYTKLEDDRAAAVQKKLYKLSPCPEHTHLRLYFDPYYFIAIPLASRCQSSENRLLAYDAEQELHYLIHRIDA